eukprot:1318797-Pleurochrysis_carterae.AAC.3
MRHNTLCVCDQPRAARYGKRRLLHKKSWREQLETNSQAVDAAAVRARGRVCRRLGSGAVCYACARDVARSVERSRRPYLAFLTSWLACMMRVSQRRCAEIVFIPDVTSQQSASVALNAQRRSEQHNGAHQRTTPSALSARPLTCRLGAANRHREVIGIKLQQRASEA